MRRPLTLGIVSVAVAAALASAFFAWVNMYPNGDDPKNIRYVLWTYGLNRNMNLDDAVNAMAHDSYPERMVVGLTKDQIVERFGYLRPAWGGYVPPGSEAFSLRRSIWVVILTDGIAVKLYLCKG